MSIAFSRHPGLATLADSDIKAAAAVLVDHLGETGYYGNRQSHPAECPWPNPDVDARPAYSEPNCRWGVSLPPPGGGRFRAVSLLRHRNRIR